MKHHAVFLMVLLVCGTLGAAIFGGEPYEVFDQGGTNDLVMGNSLIDDQITLYGEGSNRQGDTCLENSAYMLDDGELPSDAIVIKAYLIWMGAVDPAKLDEPTDNTVYLSFIRNDGYAYQTEVIAGDAPRRPGDTSDPFLFESVRFAADVMTGCSETEPGTAITADLAYFTYRTEVTDFFSQIQQQGREAGLSDGTVDGRSLYGDYRVSGLDCTQDDRYRCPTLMVSNWTLLVIYQSQKLPATSIYLYPGFSFKKDETAEVSLSGLDLPFKSTVQMRMLSAEGDPALISPGGGFEKVLVRGTEPDSFIPVTNDCDPEDGIEHEVWDSRRSTFAISNGYCTGYGDKYTFGLDIDQWFFDAMGSPELAAIFPKGTAAINLSFGFSADEVLTNLIILAVNKSYLSFDIPYKDELSNCVCYPEEPHEVFCAGEPQYILLTVENWGDDIAESVYAQVEYDPGVFDYVPGTTEIATKFDGSGNGVNWEKFLDGPEGAFPLWEPNLIANTLDTFQKKPDTAATYLIRFQLLPKMGLAKNCTGKVSAVISSASVSYLTNQNLPVTLFPGECPKSCTEKELRERCGGLSSDQAQIFKPEGDENVLPDEQPDETPDDAAVDPKAIHPMTAQTPGCSLTVL